jgi:hypothetical protein
MDCPRFVSERRNIFNFYENDDAVFHKWELPMLLDFSHIPDIAMAIEDPRVEPFVDWSEEADSTSDSIHPDGAVGPDDPNVQSTDTVSDINPLVPNGGAHTAGAAFRAAMEAVLHNLDNSTAAMDAVTNDIATRTRITRNEDINAVVSTNEAGTHDRNSTEDKNSKNPGENSLSTISGVHNEGELPDIDQTINDEYYPSNSAFSFNYENENYDKTPEFEPEWDPG